MLFAWHTTVCSEGGLIKVCVHLIKSYLIYFFFKLWLFAVQLSATDIFGPQAQTWDAKQNSEMSPPFFDFGTSSAGSSTAQKITAILLLIP